MKVSEGLEKFLDYLREIDELNRISISSEQDATDETQDILHSLELEDHNYQDYAQLAKKLRAIRRSRRCSKNLMIQTAPVVEWIKSNRNVINGLEQLLGKVRKEEKNAEGRIYTPKTSVLDKEVPKNKKRK